MRPKVVVVGCGIVGAMIAYELSAKLEADIHVVDKQTPGQGSTGAALGVLMGVISGKVKGRTWRLREASIQSYRSLIATLSQQGYSVPFNSQGIVSLCYDEAKLPRWQTLQEKRTAQGWPLEIWSPQQLKSRCPHIELERDTADGNQCVVAAIYSPADAQVHPVALTQALVSAAKQRNVTFHENTTVRQLKMSGQHCVAVQTTTEGVALELAADWVVLAAGLGSASLTRFGLTRSGSEPLALMPVLGQAMEIQLPDVLGDVDFQPVINGDDIQFVPLGSGRYWLGATVEFPNEAMNFDEPLLAKAEGLQNLQKGAAGFCHAIAQAKIIRTWSGLRPRPVGQPAPVIKPLSNTQNVTLATGHYRNGVLLAPATAQQVCELLREAF
ncbi:MAG: FAD-dependent oxidoreductase [Cyanobacteria bacterium J06588_5]